MKSFFYTFVLSYLFLGCQDSEEFSISNKQPLQNYEIWVLNNVNNFLNSINQLTRSFGQREVDNIYVWSSNDFDVDSRKSSENNEAIDTLFYIINFKNDKGFILLEPEEKSGRILGFIEKGHLTPGVEVENDVIRSYLNSLQYFIPNQEVSRDTMLRDNFPFDTYDFWSIDSIVPPLLNTHWGQGYPFNMYCYTDSGCQAVAGCVAIATAQIIAYHQYPSNYNNHSYLWSEILPWPSSQSGKESVANLVHDIGILVNMNYGVSQSSANYRKVRTCLDSLNYDYSSFGIHKFNKTMQSLESELPVLMGGIDYNNNIGHSWVIDGGIIRNHYQKQMTLEGYVIHIVDTQNLVHCNWGWEGYYDGYYMSNVFQLSNQILTDSLTISSPSSSNIFFDYDLKAYYGIQPDTLQ